jgi:hypothetical protein
MAASRHPLNNSAEQLARQFSSLNVAAKRKFLALGDKTNPKNVEDKLSFPRPAKAGGGFGDSNIRRRRFRIGNGR